MTAIASFAARALGSPLRLQVVAAVEPGPSLARVWSTVLDEFALVDADLSCYRPDSALSGLNGSAGSGTWWPASPRLYGFLSMAERAGRKTEGRFDPRVLADLDRLGHPGLVVATSAFDRRGGAARDGPGDGPWLEREARTRRVRLRAVVDSGGLGKGLALRWAARRIACDLDGRGALLEAGGDVIALGAAPGGEPWRVGIEDPSGGTDPLAVVSLTDGAICTSSIALQHWIDPAGRPAHHLLDPRTGEPGGDGLRAVTVAASDPAWAEVWTKALFLAGPRRIGDEARRRGLAAWWVEPDGTLRMTPAARLRTTWAKG